MSEGVNAAYDSAADVPRLLTELDRLHSWDGLMSLLDEHWPEDLHPTLDDDATRDPGPRIVSLLRWVNTYRAVADGAYAEVDRLRAENTALRAKVDAVLPAIEKIYRDYCDEENKRPNDGLTYGVGAAVECFDAVDEILNPDDEEALALGLVQDREGQADA